jgi:4-hydroxybenzoate polyprenyltransferase
VVIGVLATAVFASKLLQVETKVVWLAILALATWSFYSSDHLIDGLKSKTNSVIFRHAFHYKFYLPISILTLVSGITALILSLIYLDNKIITSGLSLCLIVIIYFLILFLKGETNSWILQKELIIAFVYVSGIWLAPLIWNNKIPNTFIQIVITVLFLMAWAEGIMASFFDFENDQKENQSSFTILLGKKNTRRFLIIIHILIFVIIKISVFYITTNTEFVAMLIMALMNFSLLLIILNPIYFMKNEKYRILGEMVFWLPVAIFIVDFL